MLEVTLEFYDDKMDDPRWIKTIILYDGACVFPHKVVDIYKPDWATGCRVIISPVVTVEYIDLEPTS